jgi:transposase
MVNQLKVAMQKKIQTLISLEWSFRKIARELGIHRDTVARYAHLPEEGKSKPANATPESEAEADSKPANATPGSMDPRSQCKPFEEVILKFLKQGLSGKRIWQDLASEYGFTGSYSSIKRYLRRLNKTIPLPFRRMECAPGIEAQIDFGKGAFIQEKDKRRHRPHVLRITLSHSRKGYSEAVPRQTTDYFIRCLENAFWYFGGVPATLVIDNLRAAVTRADWYDPDLNAKIQSFAEHYGTVILPTKSYTPRHKGKIESGIGYVQDNGLKGRTFSSFEEHNRFLVHWEENVADTRIHGTTRRQVGKVFGEVEQEKLLPLPRERFPFFYECERKVHRDGHVEVDKSYYSVPPEYLGRSLLVRWDARLVRIYTGQHSGCLRQVAIHVKNEPGRFSTDPKHIASEKICYVERGATWLLQKIRRIGLQSAAWAETMLEARGIPGVRVLAGLLSLSKRYSADQINHACGIALTHGAFKLRVIREILKRKIPPQAEFDFMERHPIIREMADYGNFVEVQFKDRGAKVIDHSPFSSL